MISYLNIFRKWFSPWRVTKVWFALSNSLSKLVKVVLKYVCSRFVSRTILQHSHESVSTLQAEHKDNLASIQVKMHTFILKTQSQVLTTGWTGDGVRSDSLRSFPVELTHTRSHMQQTQQHNSWREKQVKDRWTFVEICNKIFFCCVLISPLMLVIYRQLQEEG